MSAQQVHAALTALEGSGAEILDYYEHFGLASVRIRPESAAALRRQPFVDFIDVDEPATYYGVGGEERPATTLSAQTVPWGIQLVNAPAAWPIEDGAGSTRRLMLIDYKYDQSHQDLPALNLATQCSGPFGGSAACQGSDSHGTLIAGVIAARDNSFGVVGVAPGLPDSQFYFAQGVAGGGVPNESYTIAALNQAVTLGVSVISMSYGWSYVNQTDLKQGVNTAVQTAWSQGAVIVAAVGNAAGPYGSTLLSQPAVYLNVVGVSGVLPDGSFANTSPCNVGGSPLRSVYNGTVDIAAPFHVLSTKPYNSYTTSPVCGTSFAAPHVAGALYLLRTQAPHLSNAQAVSILLSTADGGAYNFHTGHGIVDVAAALGPLPQPLVTSSYAGGNPFPYQYETFYYTIHGAGFDPNSVEIVVTHPSGGTSNWASYAVKTTTQLHIPSLVLGTPGTYTLRVRNGPSGTFAANIATLTIRPR